MQGILVAIASCLIPGHWVVYGLAAPVTTCDSDTCNLDGLLLAERGGLFGNQLGNDLRQVIFPWSIDAIHYVPVKPDWGVSIPSSGCSAGFVIIVFKIAGKSGVEDLGWMGCLALVALPTVVFQAAASKNDVRFFSPRSSSEASRHTPITGRELGTSPGNSAT